MDEKALLGFLMDASRRGYAAGRSAVTGGLVNRRSGD